MSEDDSSSEDVDYEPTAKEVKEAEAEKHGSKRQKTAGGAAPVASFQEGSSSRKAEEVWQKLRPSGLSSTGLNYAALCRPAPTDGTPAADREWLRQFGIAVRPQAKKHGNFSSTPPAENISSSSPSMPETGTDGKACSSISTPGGRTATTESKVQRGTVDVSIAARALAAAKQAASSTTSRNAGQVEVMETRRFAGKDVQVSKLATAEEAEKCKAKEQERRRTAGLDAVLASLQETKKVNVLDKSRDDWGTFKQGDAHIAEELEAYKKSGGKYLDKVEFLKRAELREYEAERDTRMSGGLRSRGPAT